jgi:arylsulfatase A-like enzyme
MAAPRPHIIMVLQDDLGHNDMFFDGGSATVNLTSHTSDLARQGIILEAAHTHWHCSPTR